MSTRSKPSIMDRVPFVAMTKGQRKLYRKHGTPAQFARDCYALVPATISMDEAAAAVAKYGREWRNA